MTCQKLIDRNGRSADQLMYEDNQGCLAFVKTERASGRAKHIATNSLYTRVLCVLKTVQLIYCPTTEIMTEAWTKPLGPSKVQKFVKRVRLSAKPARSRSESLLEWITALALYMSHRVIYKHCTLEHFYKSTSYLYTNIHKHKNRS